MAASVMVVMSTQRTAAKQRIWTIISIPSNGRKTPLLRPHNGSPQARAADVSLGPLTAADQLGIDADQCLNPPLIFATYALQFNRTL